MSRSANQEISNPSTRFFDWSGSEGKIKFFDKSLGEKGENVFVGLPFTFLILDVLTTITGYSDEHQSGFWSNEIRDTRTEELTVRTKQGIERKGIYEQVKTITGAKYTASVYIAWKGSNGLEIGNLKLSGSAIGPFIEFKNQHKQKIYDGAVAITNALPKKKGKTEYFEPVFELRTVSEETNAQAVELDRELQEYLKSYFTRNGQPEETARAATANGNSDFAVEPPDDLPADLDESIPF
jgi:hypothetical protein